jgi:hypothetical protein
MSSEQGVIVDLPVPEDAEYRFRLCFQPERQIHATLLAADDADYLWYMPFEDAAFRNSAQDLDTAFLQTVEVLIRNGTRIIYKRGLIFEYFRCEYKTASGWKRVYAHSAFRFGGFHPPLISGRKRIYSSPAIAQ